jgi:hypothetical protein
MSKEGVISFRTSTNVRGGILTSNVVLSELDVHFKMMEKSLPELRKLVASPAEAGVQQPTIDNQPKPVPSAVNQTLIGQWKTAYRDASGNLIAQGVTLGADGKFLKVATTGNGVAVHHKGQWSYKDNIFTAINENQQVVRGTLKIVNRDRLVFHDPTLNIDLTYNRILEQKWRVSWTKRSTQ